MVSFFDSLGKLLCFMHQGTKGAVRDETPLQLKVPVLFVQVLPLIINYRSPKKVGSIQSIFGFWSCLHSSKLLLLILPC